MSAIGLVLFVLGALSFSLGYVRGRPKFKNAGGPPLNDSALLLGGAGLALVGGIIAFAG